MLRRASITVAVCLVGLAFLTTNGQHFTHGIAVLLSAVLGALPWISLLRRRHSAGQRFAAGVVVAACAIVAVKVSLHLPRAHEEQKRINRSDDGLVNFDFVDTFPHKFWISDWSSDRQYPDGFQYKLLSARREPGDMIQFLVVLQQRSGDKEVLSTLDVEPSVFDQVAAKFVDGLAKQHGLDFEEQDFSSCRTLEAFDKEAARAGWSMTKPP